MKIRMFMLTVLLTGLWCNFNAFAADSTFPATPSDLTATAVSGTQVNLRWTDNAINEDWYKIELSADANGPYQQVGNISANATSYTVNYLTPNTTGYYRVSAWNANGRSLYSNVATATTLPLPARPTNLSATTISTTQTDLRWMDHSSDEDGFVIERKIGSGGTYAQIATVAVGTVAYSDNNFTPGTYYFYRVCAYSVAGNSLYSNEVCALAPAAPSNLSATTVSITRIDLVWTDNSSNEDLFRIFRKTGDYGAYNYVATVGPNTITYSDNNLTPDTTYYYMVCAYNPGGNSEYSNEVSAATLPTIPAWPSDLSATAISSTQINLTWTDRSINESGFKIERRIFGVSGYGQIDTVPAGTVSYSDKNLTPNTLYVYMVRAYNDYGNSAYTNEANATTLPPVPAASSNLSATTVSSAQINLTWTDISSNENGFKIYRKTGANGTSAQIGTVGPGTVTYSSTFLDADTTYYYAVRAYNAGGDGGFSNVAIATTLPPTLAAPSDLSATAISGTRIDLTWTDNSSNQSGYRIKRKSATGEYALIGQVGPGFVTFSNADLTPNTTYYYKVYAYNAGGISAYSSEAFSTTFPPEIPSAPTNLSATAVSSTQINLIWTDNSSNEDGFRIERKTGASGTYSLIDSVAAGTVSYNSTNLTPNTTYYYRVRAYNAGGYSAYSNEQSAATTIVTNPVVQGSIVINDIAKVSTSRSVILKLSAASTAADMADNGKMCFSPDGTTWSAWENYAVIKEYELTKGNGTKTVYVKYKDKNNNESAGNISAIIELAEPAKMAGVSYLEGATLTPGIALNFGQKKDSQGQNLGIRLYKTSTGVPNRIHSMEGNPLPECKSITRARLNSSSYDDLIVDFGPAYGIWVCSNCKTWNLPLHSLSAESITAADINNDSKDEVIIDFGAFTSNPYKLWIYYPANGTWSPLHSISPRSVTAGNIDGIQGSDLVVDFGIYGLWIYYNNSTWVFFHSITSDQIVLGDINADNKDEVVVDFGELYGVWAYYPGVTDPNLKWKLIEGQSPKMMAIGNIDVDAAGKKDIVLDYGDNSGTTKKSGIKIWVNDAGLTDFHSMSSDGMVFSGNDLVVDFAGYGEWIYKGSITQAIKWEQLSKTNAE